MKAKRVKSKNTHLFAVRLPLTLVRRVNAARIAQGLEWAQLMSNLFERYLAEREIATDKAMQEKLGHVSRGDFLTDNFLTGPKKK